MSFPIGLGVGIPHSATDTPLTIPVVFNWFFNWHYEYHMNVNYVPMVYRNVIERNLLDKLAVPNMTWFAVNEPERSAQANLTINETLRVIDFMLEMGLKVIGPHVSIGDDYGKHWFEQYLRDGGQDLDVEAIGCHIYGAQTPEEWQTTLNWLYTMLDSYNLSDKQVVVSETCAISETGESTILDNLTLLYYINNQLKVDDRLQAVGWFSAAYREPYINANLLNPDGSLTIVGETFNHIIDKPEQLIVTIQ